MNVGAQVIARAAYPVDIARVPRQFLETLAGYLAEEPHGIIADAVPQLRIDGTEDIAGLRAPCPVQVGRQLLERLELSGDDGADGEPADGLHGGHASGRGGHGTSTSQPCSDTTENLRNDGKRTRPCSTLTAFCGIGDRWPADQ